MANTQNKKKKSTKSKTSSASKSSKSAPKDNPKKEVSQTVNRQKYAIVFMAVAVFLFCVTFIKGESAWLVLHNAMFGIFGVCAYVLPAMFVYMAVVYAKDKPLGTVAANLTGSGFFVALLSGAVHIFSNTAEYFAETGLNIQIADSWNKAEALWNGGVIGAVIGGLISEIFGKTGASITIVILLVVLAMLLTGTTLISLVTFAKKHIGRVGELTSEMIEQNVAKREREEAEKETEKKEETKKKFSPPVKPTISVEKFEDNFITDESTFTKVKESPLPEIPVVNLPDAETTDVVKDIVEEAVKESKPKRKKKAPAVPDGDPINEIEEIPVEILPDEPETEKQGYVFPPIDCLSFGENETASDNMADLQIGAQKLLATLESFNIKAEVSGIIRGPSVTRYELVPAAGVRINKITNLSDDIALRLAATSVRIEAPIPGKSAIGIEVPNSAKSIVTMREIIDTPQFRDAKSKLNVALGKDITGNIICADLAKMPHLLVAGTTGSGKSVCLNAMIVSILYNASPDEVKLLMIDPKMVEFTVYNGIAHLEVPVVSNPRKAAGALGWAVGEMEKRYKQFSENGVRDLKGFNKLCETRDDLVKMHQIVIFIDELSDLMMVSPKEVEDCIQRLAQMARAAGIHLVIATQRPSVDVITGVVKSNIPSRIALSVSSQVDSRTILDAVGAEKLLGNGDMLYNPVGNSKPTRVQGCFISDDEVEKVVNHIKSQLQTTYNEETMHEIEAKAAAAENAKKKGGEETEDGDFDPMLNEAIEVVVNAGGASTTMLQKKLKLGYARASRVMDQLEEKGIVGPSEGAKPRAVLITKQQWYEMQALADGAGSAPNIDDVFADDDDYAGSEDDFE